MDSDFFEQDGCWKEFDHDRSSNLHRFCQICGPYFQSSALYRLVELSSGSVTVDGVDISKIGLTDLRKALAIIPQDPVRDLFPSTLYYYSSHMLILPLASM